MKHSALKKICVFNIIVMINRALESGLRNNENVFSAVKIGDGSKEVDASEQLQTLLTLTAEHQGEITEILKLDQ